MRSTHSSGAIIALIASHNRRDLTVRAIELFAASAEKVPFAARAILVDDGSSDGTAAAVRQAASVPIEIIDGDGNWFWARSLATAERRALESAGDADFLLWLNDDVALDNNAVTRLLAAAKRYPAAAIVGSVRDSETGLLTYGGLKRAGRHPLAFAPIEPHETDATPAATMNGNVVLVPVPLARQLGGVDGEFSHAFADIDYGLRAAALGAGPIVAPGTYGTCSRNRTTTSPTRREAWRRFTSPKGGGDLKATARILQRATPKTWPAWWLATYSAWWARRLRRANGY